MPQMMSTSLRPSARPLLAAATLVGIFLAAALALWACYGGAVFFEMVAAGFRACF